MKRNDVKEWLNCEEASLKLGISIGHTRELCNIGQTGDKKNGIIAKKVGKSWRIPLTEINRLLGIEHNEENYKKELYIKELEARVMIYENQFKMVKNLVGSLEQLVEH